MERGHEAVALVYAFLMTHPELYCCYVAPYVSLRAGPNGQVIAQRTGAHWRRLASWAKIVPALACTCKFERLAEPQHMETPPQARRQRRDETGALIARRYRLIVWA